MIMQKVRFPLILQIAEDTKLKMQNIKCQCTVANAFNAKKETTLRWTYSTAGQAGLGTQPSNPRWHLSSTIHAPKQNTRWRLSRDRGIWTNVSPLARATRRWASGGGLSCKVCAISSSCLSWASKKLGWKSSGKSRTVEGMAQGSRRGNLFGPEWKVCRLVGQNRSNQQNHQYGLHRTRITMGKKVCRIY